MPPGMLLRRMWRERRLLSILLLAICLVTGFFALGPLYVRAISEAGVRFEVENTAPEQLNITLSNSEPIGPDAWELLNRELSGVVTQLVTSARSAGTVCGYRYTLGQPTTLFTPSTPNCYQIVGYSNLHELFTLSAGRWPVRLPPPEAVSPAGLSDEEQAARQVGVYSRGQVEAVITTQAAEEANIEIGNRVVVGAEPDRTAIVHIVGFVEPALPPDDPFWEGQRIVLSGQYVPISVLQERYDFGLIIPEGAYADWIAPVTNGNTYIWRMKTNPDVIHADTLDVLEARLARAESGLRARYPDIQVFSGLASLITRFRAGLQATEGPIVLLSGAVLVLMLYHLVTTVALVLEQQSSEWASITSRGGSTAQLIGMQLATVGVLGVLGLVAGPFIAQGILLGLERIGPLALVLGGASLGVRSLPPGAFWLSGFAALAAVIVLTLPAWPAARRSLLHLKQLISRPPTRPAWARYFLDVILLLAGLGFMLRLYFMVGGDPGQSLQTLLQDPASLIRLIASGADEVGGLNDPFNLIGPALLLTGAALLWLRLFPLIMRLFSRLFAGVKGLTVPLALWNVERDPGHYAQLVLLLIGTLALGTASLALSATRDVGAWAVAQQETGGYARLELNPRQADPEQDWLALPDVTGGASLMVAATAQRAGRAQTTLFGVEPETFREAFPALDGAVAPLIGTTPPFLPGQLLPEGTAMLTMQVYAAPGPEDTPTQTAITVELMDALGVPLEIAMSTPIPTDSGRFVTYTAALPEGLGRAPWRLIGFRLLSRRGDLQDFTHTIYLDDVRAVSADGSETVVADFEDGIPEGWTPAGAQFQLPTDLTVALSTAWAASGAAGLQIDYRIRRVGGAMLEPRLAVRPAQPQTIPVVVSEAFADYYGRRTNRRQPLNVGDEGQINLTLPVGEVVLRYRVVGVIRDFPTMTPRDRFVLAQLDALRPVVNAPASVHEFYDRNQVWLELATREPSPDFKFAALGTPGVMDAVYAWDRYNEIQREPLPNAITGMLFAGFWVSLALSILDFAFYLAVTARRRAVSFAVLQAMGWKARNIWGLLAVEQAALVMPALLVGVALGAGLAYLLLPFLELVGGEVLRIPLVDVMGLLVVLVASFVALLGVAAIFLQRLSVNQVLRLGEE